MKPPRTLPKARAGGHARPGPDHEQRVLRAVLRPARRHRADLSPDRGQLPILDRSVRDHHGAAGGARRHRVDAVRHAHDAVGPGADRRHHVHGRRHRQQRAGHQLRPRAAGAARRCGRRRDRSRLRPAASGADDGARHDHRHAADGARLGRRRRTECAARPRRRRRPYFAHGRNADVRSGRFQHHSPTPRRRCAHRRSEKPHAA